MGLRSYPKVYNLGHKAVVDLLAGRVVVQEKVDGSQFSFGLNDDGLAFRSRGADINPDDPPKMFASAVETVKRLAAEHKLPPYFIFRGEVLDKPKHNALAYDRTPIGNIILFDVEKESTDQAFLTPCQLNDFGAALGLEVVPNIYDGPGESLTLEGIKGMLERMSVLGGAKVEGVVIKAYGRFGLDGKTIMGKYVSEAFKEVAGQEWKVANPKLGDIVQQLIEKYRTPARWEKAVNHLREQGLIQDEPKDIGLLLRELTEDTKEECGDEIAETLHKWGWPRIMRGIQAGFAEWYKSKLAERQWAPVGSGPTLEDPLGVKALDAESAVAEAGKVENSVQAEPFRPAGETVGQTCGSDAEGA